VEVQDVRGQQTVLRLVAVALVSMGIVLLWVGTFGISFPATRTGTISTLWRHGAIDPDRAALAIGAEPWSEAMAPTGPEGERTGVRYTREEWADRVRMQLSVRESMAFRELRFRSSLIIVSVAIICIVCGAATGRVARSLGRSATPDPLSSNPAA